MPQIDWIFLCDYASVDPAGKMSIIGMFENINVPGLPFKLPQMYIAVNLRAAGGENFELSSRISAPNGSEVARQGPVKIVIPPNLPSVGKIYATFAYFGTVFNEPGEFHIELFINENSVHILPVTVSLRQPLVPPMQPLPHIKPAQ